MEHITLQEFLQRYPKAAIALSGGVDSAYLLYEAVKICPDVRAYYVKSAFQPQFELDDAKKIAEFAKADMRILKLDILMDGRITGNPENRCYYCKKRIFFTIRESARQDGFPVIFDGTNASDDADERPGMKALKEMSVLSPLRECGLTKNDIRRLSKEAGLFTWDKPSYACLATRIPVGTKITAHELERTETAEDFLFSMGFKNFRIRMSGDAARIQIPEAQFAKIFECREQIVTKLKNLYNGVFLDLEPRDGF